MENGKENKSEPVGLILAAGYSSRMGAFKPLLPIGDATAIERVADTLRQAGIKQIIGVTGFQRERLNAIFAGKEIVEAYNQDFEQGMFTSIKKGIRTALDAASSMPEGFFLMLVDCPLVPPEVLRLILEKHKENPEAFIVPCYHGKKGHPLFIPIRYAEEILTYDGDGGLKAITNRHEDKLIRLEVGLESVVLDMDTPEGYEEILAYYQKKLERTGSGSSSTAGVHADEEEISFERQLQGKRIFFIRHGQIRQHSEKIFLGQTDIPLSDKGKEQALQAAAELETYRITSRRIYTSDLSRAAETAEIIREHLQKSFREIELIKEPKFREMSLGEWDGRFISEIREKYPEEYQKRGENLLSYKFGNDSENFYDLQYRTRKGLQNILDLEAKINDGSKDILVVSHWGVINVILSSLCHTQLGVETRKPVPNGGIIVMDYT